MKAISTAIFLLFLSFQCANAQTAKWVKISRVDQMTDKTIQGYALAGTNQKHQTTPYLVISCRKMTYIQGGTIYGEAPNGDTYVIVSYRGDVPRPKSDTFTLTPAHDGILLNRKVLNFMLQQHKLVLHFETSNGDVETSTFDVAGFPSTEFAATCKH